MTHEVFVFEFEELILIVGTRGKLCYITCKTENMVYVFKEDMFHTVFKFHEHKRYPY
jgi:hypothetical protein